MSDWPFSIGELTAGLRRYFAEPALKVKAVAERPLSLLHPPTGRVRGLHVDYAVGLETIGIECVVKEPRGTSRAGLAGAGRREIGLYQSLAAQLPMPTPALIAADPAGDWFVMEAVEADIPPEAWTADHYRLGVKTLAGLHERFWNLGDDLGAYNWLARPLNRDFEIHVYAAAQAVEKLTLDDRLPMITGSMTVLGALGQIISQVEQIAGPLRALPPTLLHGTFWPGNIALQTDGEMILMDWESVSLGPGLLDLVGFTTISRWEIGLLPVSEADLTALYRQEIQHRTGACWSDAEWRALLDCAFLWRFIQEMFAWVARVSPDDFAARAADFEAIWLKPVLAVVDRQLRPVFYF